MDFELSEEQCAIQDTAREAARNKSIVSRANCPSVRPVPPYHTVICSMQLQATGAIHER
jgi:hypothetical protein